MENNLPPQPSGTPETVAPAAEQGISAEQLQEIKEKLRMQQNLPMGIAASALAAIAGAALWAGIAIVTDMRIGYVAVAIGLMVGFANRFAGKGIDQTFGIVGAVFAFLGCFFGNYFTYIALLGDVFNMSFFEALGLVSFTGVVKGLIEIFNIYDVLFYAIALYEGYKFSFRQVTEDDLKKHL